MEERRIWSIAALVFPTTGTMGGSIGKLKLSFGADKSREFELGEGRPTAPGSEGRFGGSGGGPRRR